MLTQQYATVVIDDSNPRTPYERCITLFDHLTKIAEVGPHSDLDPEVVRTQVDAEYDWNELEDEIIGEINAKLPDEYLCVKGETNPGDVIIIPINELDDDPCDCGTVTGETGLYITHALGSHPDCTGGDEPQPEAYGWTWFGPEDDPDERGTGWIEIGRLDENGNLGGDPICEIICRNFEQVKAEHPEWIEAREKQAEHIVRALNLADSFIELRKLGFNIAPLLLSLADKMEVQAPGPEAS
jgi:hypothetical protein